MSQQLDRQNLLDRLTDTRKRSPVPVVAQALYLYLVNEAESLGSGAAMPLSDRRIALDLCISVQRMRRARSVLVELGLVSFTPSRSRREYPVYTFAIAEEAEGDDTAPVASAPAASEPCPVEPRAGADNLTSTAEKQPANTPAPPRLTPFERMKRRSLKHAGSASGPGRKHRNGHNKSA